MKIKRFYADSSRDALRMVREALGADAIILSNRQVDGGVEIVAAIDFDEEKIQQTDFEVESPVYQAPPKKPVAPQMTTSSFSEQLKQQVAAPANRPMAASGPNAPMRHALPIKEVIQTPKPASAPSQADATQKTVETLRQDLAQMRQMLESRLAAPAAPAATLVEAADIHISSRHQNLSMPLIKMGFSTRLARQMVADIPDGDAPVDAEQALRAYLKRHLSLAQAPLDGGGVIAVMGPTGVGKTTTIAKMAAHYALKYGAGHVALLTTDTYRIAGTEHLRIYGRILGIPVEVVQDQMRLQERLDALSKKRLILIDTVGFSPRDERLERQLTLFSGVRQNVHKALVVNAAAGRSHQQLVLDTYGKQGLDSFILSKVDEMPKLGEAIDMLLQFQVPLSFYTDGQRVPEDLHGLDLERLMDLLMGRPIKTAETTDIAATHGRLAAYSMA